MKTIKKTMTPEITTITDYPDDGKHQECYIGLPFDIRKGEDSYQYIVKGVKKMYNSSKSTNKIDDRWIVHLEKGCGNKSLKNIFEIKLNKDLNKIISYCRKIYMRSLEMEIKRIQTELNDMIKAGE